MANRAPAARADAVAAGTSGVAAHPAAATSLPLGTNELELANALQPFKVAKSKNSDILVPAQTEIVFEGYISLEERHDEGPFVDLTEMYDIVRQEPVFTVEKITHRKDAIYHALLPGCLEHKLLMGMPREPTIFKEVNKVAKCLDVSITPGGCSWLHAAVKIKKAKEEDGKNAIEAAFKGHSSLKHAFIVDEDIDILNPSEIEWAMATRFQADKDLVIKDKSKGSSLDPPPQEAKALPSARMRGIQASCRTIAPAIGFATQCYLLIESQNRITSFTRIPSLIHVRMRSKYTCVYIRSSKQLQVGQQVCVDIVAADLGQTSHPKDAFPVRVPVGIKSCYWKLG